MVAELLRIGELAKRAGVSVRALRYYEEQGLLAPDRSAAGQRMYREVEVARVRFFQQMYAAGLNSRNVAELLPCVDAGHTNAEQRRMLREPRDFLHSFARHAPRACGNHPRGGAAAQGGAVMSATISTSRTPRATRSFS